MSSALKILLIGESKVGKTSFIQRLQNKEFLENQRSTVDVEFHTLTLNFRNRPLKLSIYDFSGKPQYRFMQASHLRGSYGAILMYDLTNEDSFKKLDDWIAFLQPILKNYSDFPIVLVGNKFDLGNMTINEDELDTFLMRNNIKIYEKISVKTGMNIEQPLQKLIYFIFQKYMENQKKAKEALKEEIKAEVHEEVKAEVHEEVKAEVHEEVKAEVHEEVKAEVHEEVKAEVQEEEVEKRVENEIDIVTPMAKAVEDMARLDLREARRDLRSLRENIIKSFKVLFSSKENEKKKKKKT
ncbi:MAG: GTP-binding protein [Candidatus Lokiarchaeota archaeon]|nr:GTP-binding protein [Candidatus Lokiarchaeota archaeon]